MVVECLSYMESTAERGFQFASGISIVSHTVRAEQRKHNNYSRCNSKSLKRTIYNPYAKVYTCVKGI